MNIMKNAPRAEVNSRRLPAGLGRWMGAAGLAVLALGWPALASAQTSDVVAQRQEMLDREAAKQQAQQTYQVDLEKSETEVWSPSKTMINLDARCPVVTTLGFFGAFGNASGDPAKASEAAAQYAQLQQVAQPIAAELMKIATSNKFVGLTFPSALEPRLNVLRGQLYGAVVKIYGDAAFGELQNYVSAQSQGVLVGRTTVTQ
jgi:hypothetical protein